MSSLAHPFRHHQRTSTSPPSSPTVSGVTLPTRPANHKRTTSWPPTATLLHFTHPLSKLPSTVLHPHAAAKSHRHHGPLDDDLDADPFAHFLSPVADDELEDELLAFSAGIVTAPTPPPSSDHHRHHPHLLHLGSAGAGLMGARGARVRHALRDRWDRYVARYHPHMHPRMPERTSSDRLVRAEAESHSRQQRRFLEKRKMAPVTSPTEDMEDDEGYASAWSAPSTPTISPLTPSSSSMAVDGSGSDGAGLEYRTLSSGKRVRIEPRAPSPQLLARVAAAPRPDTIAEQDEPVEHPDRTPSPTLGHAAIIASANERVRKRARSRRKRPAGVAVRRRSWREPDGELFTVVEEGED